MSLETLKDGSFFLGFSPKFESAVYFSTYYYVESVESIKKKKPRIDVVYTLNRNFTSSRSIANCRIAQFIA